MRLRFALVIAWAALIFFASSIPNPPGASGDEWRYNLAHLVEYAILGALTFIALKSFRPLTPLRALVLSAWVLATLYGMSDEFHQSFVPNRDANWLDVGFDSFGAALGIGVAHVFRRLRPLPDGT